MNTRPTRTSQLLVSGCLQWILFCALLLVCSQDAQAQANSTEGQPPNVVFLLVDDLGWADLPSYGNGVVKTPNIDRLVGDGMRFTNAYAASPVCAPSRASLQTGLYPARIGMNAIHVAHPRPWARLTPPTVEWPLPEDTPTLAEALGATDYRSTYIGKWHLGFTEAAQPPGRGYSPPPADTAAGLNPAYRSEVARFARQNPHKHVGEQTLRAVQFIEQNQDQPFFLYLGYDMVHVKLDARTDLVEKYAEKMSGMDPEMHAEYAAMLETLDESVGLLLKSLNELDLSDDTAVFLFSDNGGLIQIYHGAGPVVTSNSPLRGEKGTLYEGGIRVPFVVRWPGVVEAGSESDELVISNDIFPTIMDMAGVDDGTTPDGRSLMPLLRDQEPINRETLFFHYPHYHHSTPAAAIRHENWKLLEFYEDNRLELYDLSEDLGERENLASERPAKAKALQKRLHAWQDSVDAAMPTENPEYNPSKAHIWGKHVPPGKQAIPVPMAPGKKCQWISCPQ